VLAVHWQPLFCVCTCENQMKSRMIDWLIDWLIDVHRSMTLFLTSNCTKIGRRSNCHTTSVMTCSWLLAIFSNKTMLTSGFLRLWRTTFAATLTVLPCLPLLLQSLTCRRVWLMSLLLHWFSSVSSYYKSLFATTWAANEMIKTNKMIKWQNREEVNIIQFTVLYNFNTYWVLDWYYTGCVKQWCSHILVLSFITHTSSHISSLSLYSAHAVTIVVLDTTIVGVAYLRFINNQLNVCLQWCKRNHMPLLHQCHLSVIFYLPVVTF